MAARHSGSRRWVASVRWATALALGGSVLAGCGAAQTGSSSSRVEGDATATFAVALTQVAEAKNFVATTTAEAKANKPTPSATARATVAAEPTATTNPFADVVPSPNFEGDVLALLPFVEQLPEGFQVAGESPLTAEDVASSYSDKVGYLQKLEAWGFRQGAARVFARAQLTPAEQKTVMTTFNTAVLEFGSPEQTRASMEANRDYVKKGMIGDPPNVTLEGLGDYALALEGEVRNGNTFEQWAFVWVQKGNLVLYFRAMSLGYVPIEETIQIATTTLAR